MSSQNAEAGPVIKWAGGKRQLLHKIVPLLTEGPGCDPVTHQVGHYVEPFIGGGAVFFAMANLKRFRRATIGDANPELVVLYTAVRDHVDALIEALSQHKRLHTEDYFWRLRDSTEPGLARQALANPNALWLVRVAARTIYLNKTCFNGLYRLNAEGRFNVPYGKPLKPAILDEQNLRAASAALFGVGIVHGDFEATLSAASLGPGDAVYFDPPYLPVSDSSSFSGYVYNPFGMSDQRRLARVFTDLGTRGVTAVLSNSSTPETRVLFGDPHALELVPAKRSINSAGDKRGEVDEVLSVARRL